MDNHQIPFAYSVNNDYNETQQYISHDSAPYQTVEDSALLSHEIPTQQSLFLNREKLHNYRCEPLVIMSILDHHKRRDLSQQRVIGILLGSVDSNGAICLTNSFPLIHDEIDNRIGIDSDYEEKMTELHYRINPNEVVVGWYSTETIFTFSTAICHQSFVRQFTAENRGYEPVLLFIDTNLENYKLSVKAYHVSTISVKRGEGNETESNDLVSRYECIPLVICASPAEKIGVDVLISGRPDNREVLDSPSSIIPDVDSLKVALADLYENLSFIESYVDKVVNSVIPGNSDIGREIEQALSAIPHIDTQTFEKMFSSDIQDLLMIVYLSNLTQTHLALVDKIGLFL